MADKDGFSFDKDAAPTPQPAPEPAAEKKAQPAPSRALLLGLLLVVLGAAAYFYAMEMMAPEDVAVPAGVAKQLITPPPPPPAADATASGKQAPALADKPAEASNSAAGTEPTPVSATETTPAAQELPKLAEKGVLKEVPIEPPPVATEAVSPAAPAVAEATAGSPTATVDTPSAPSAPEPGPKPGSKVSAVGSQPSRGAYTLLAGAYISPEMLKSATSKVKKLGYQPRTLRDAKQVEMTRVRIGAYAPGEAQAKLAEIKKLAPDAFTLPEGEQVVVYAASHFNPVAHSAFADRLRKAGVAFEEEKVMRKMPMTELFFGDFPDRDAAEKAAVKARRAGLEIIVFKRP